MSDVVFTRSIGSATTFNRATRTVEVTMLSGPAPAVRPAPAPDGSNTRWVEELDARGADLSRLNGGPALRDHVPTTDNAVGSVENARVEGDKIVGTVRFDGSPEAEALMSKIEAGSVRAVSLGYRVRQFARVGNTSAGLPIFRATKWVPFECSFVPVGIDPGATVRSQGGNMDNEQTAAPTDTGATTINVDINGIRGIAKAANLPDSWTLDRIADGATVEQARTLAFDEVCKRSAAPIDGSQRRAHVTNDDNNDPILIRSAMADALAARVAPALVKPEGRATVYAGWSILDMAAELANVRGDRLDARNKIECADAIFTRAHSTSDFPLLLEAAANKTLLGAYQTAAPTFTRWASQKSFNDFKPHKYLRLGDFPALQEITAENGPVKFGTIGEHRETVQAKEWATGIEIGRRLLINDDLGALGDFTSMAGQRIAYDQNATMYALLQSNSGAGPALADGKGVFHTDHGNKSASGTTIDETNISAAVQAMGAQTTLDGLIMNIRPNLLVCGPAKEVAARKLVAAITPNQTTAVNVYSGQFEILVDANVTGNRWFLFSTAVPVFVHGYVTGGQSGPTAKSEVDFNTLAVRLRVGLDWGFGAIDHRGAYTNAGA